jgi:LysM repeat protein
MDSSFTERWIRKFRIVTLSLIFSGALNIGLIAALIAVLFQERQSSLSLSRPSAVEAAAEPTNSFQLQAYSRLSFRELCAMLTNTDLVEDGLTKRDLALAALVSFHDFNLEKAIGIPSQRRAFSMDGRPIELYPGLSDDQYGAILHYAYLEKWPLTSRGLFLALQKSAKPRDEALVQAFSLSPEFFAVQTLFQKSEAPITADQIIDLISSGTWQMLDGFVHEQTQMLDFSVERRRHLVLSYLALQSPAAADLLLQTDFAFALKRLNDPGVIDVLSQASMSDTLQKFCIELMHSARSDAVYEKSAEWLYKMANEEMPKPFDKVKAMARFTPQPVAAPVAAKKQEIQTSSSGKTYVVQEGDSLWKIARHHHVTVEDIIKLNKLEKEKIKPKMILKIPGK